MNESVKSISNPKIRVDQGQQSGLTVHTSKILFYQENNVSTKVVVI
jgi:hypothetical protein